MSEKISDEAILRKVGEDMKSRESQSALNYVASFVSTAERPSPFMQEILEQVQNRKQYLQDYADAREAFLLEQQANEEEFRSAMEAEDRASDARNEERQLNKEQGELISSVERRERLQKKLDKEKVKREEEDARIKKLRESKLAKDEEMRQFQKALFEKSEEGKEKSRKDAELVAAQIKKKMDRDNEIRAEKARRSALPAKI